MRRQPLAQWISEMFPKIKPPVFEDTRLKNRRAVPMSQAIGAGVDLTRFESDYHYNPHFDILFVERGSRLDIWLYLAC